MKSTTLLRTTCGLMCALLLAAAGTVGTVQAHETGIANTGKGTI